MVPFLLLLILVDGSVLWLCMDVVWMMIMVNVFWFLLNPMSDQYR